MQIPGRLISEIKAGNCVAFVGAGFSQPATPPWTELLVGLAGADLVDEATRERVQRLVANKSSKDLEAAAQTLRDALGDPGFGQALSSLCDSRPGNERMDRRLQSLNSIPFRAVLTTNFDGILPGNDPGRETYLDVLRPSGHRWFDRRFWDPTQNARSVVTLHGNVDDPSDIVFTRQDYRRRLYATPGYVTFLRSVMATTTVLYLGFSFTDAYLDELRSEILALLEYQGGDQPIAYALLSDATSDEVAYARTHEGMEIIPYESAGGHAAFDEFLAELGRSTSPQLTLGALLADSHIVWIDPSAASVGHGLDFLSSAVGAAEGESRITMFDSADEALDTVAAEGADLVVTHWGHGLGPAGGSTAQHVLGEIRRRNLEVPAMVFASAHHADANKRAAMALGATSFEHTWEGLFREIERVFTPGSVG